MSLFLSIDELIYKIMDLHTDSYFFLYIQLLSRTYSVGLSSQSPLETSGIRYSDAIEGLLPSEMMLLAGLGGDDGDGEI